MRLMVGKVEREIAMGYKDVFKDISFSTLCAYIALYFCGCKSLCELVRNFAFVASVSKLSRDIGKMNNDTLNRAMRRMRAKVLKKIKASPDDWIYAFDTTDNPKRLKGVRGGGKWATSKGSIYIGRNILVIVAINIKKGYAIPLTWSPCIKPKEDPVNGKTAWELALEDIKILLNEGFPKLPIVADSWFDGVPFLNELNQLGLDFVIEIKSNRMASFKEDDKYLKIDKFFNGKNKKQAFGATKIPEKIPSGFKYNKFLKSVELYLRSSRKPGADRQYIRLQVVALYNHPSSRKPFAFYSSNCLEKSNAWLWQMSRFRWNIEVMFRDLKQKFLWGTGMHKTDISADISIVIPLLIITHLRLSEEYECKSIGKSVEVIKTREELRSLDYFYKHRNSNRVAIFFNRKSELYINQKPRNEVVHKAVV